MASKMLAGYKRKHVFTEEDARRLDERARASQCTAEDDAALALDIAEGRIATYVDTDGTERIRR